MIGPFAYSNKRDGLKSVVDQAEYDNINIVGGRAFGLKDAIGQQQTWTLDTVIGVYKRSPYINGAVNYISSQAIHAPLRVYRLNGSGQKTLVTGGQPHNMLHEWVNPHQTYQDLITATINWITLLNNCFWILEENNDPSTKSLSPVSIYVANPRYLKVIVSRDDKVAGYRYEVGDKEIFIPKNRVIPFPGWSPDDYWFGHNNIEALDTDIQVERFGKKQSKTYFANKAIISGVLTIEDDVDEDEVKRLEKQFYEQHRGTNNAYRIMVLTAGMTYEPFDPDQVDDAVVQQIETSIQTHETVTGVPLPLLNSTFLSERELIEYESLFWRRTMMPMLERIAATMTKTLARPLSKNLCVCPDYRKVRALQLHDLEATKVDIARAKVGLNTPNEIRQQRNEAPYTGDLADFGDMPYPVWAVEFGPDVAIDDSINMAGSEGGRDQSDGSEPEMIDETGTR